MGAYFYGQEFSNHLQRNRTIETVWSMTHLWDLPVPGGKYSPPQATSATPAVPALAPLGSATTAAAFPYPSLPQAPSVLCPSTHSTPPVQSQQCTLLQVGGQADTQLELSFVAQLVSATPPTLPGPAGWAAGVVTSVWDPARTASAAWGEKGRESLI